MAVARNADGRMELFARGTDRALIHTWQLGPNTGWAHEWSSLGGILRSVPAVARNADGRLEIFVLGGPPIADPSISHIFQTAPNNGWSGWQTLGVVGAQPMSAPVVARNQDGRLELFSIMTVDEQEPSTGNFSTHSDLFHNFQDAPGAGWVGWQSLRRPDKDIPGLANDRLVRLGSESVFPQFDVGRNADGRLEAFAVTSGGRLWHTWQMEPNSRRPWSPWAPLDSPPGGLDKAPIVVLNAGGDLEVFSRGPDGRVWHIAQGGANNGWTFWDSLGGKLTSAPAVGRNADGRLEVFGRGLDHEIWHTWQGPGGWSAWEKMPPSPFGGPPTGMLTPIQDTDAFPSVGPNADGRLQVFGRTSLPVSRAWTSWQRTEGIGGWAAWDALDTWNVHLEGALGRGLIEPW